MDVIISLGVSLFLLTLGCIIGTKRELAHFQSLKTRERDLSNIFTTDLKSIPVDWKVESVAFVTGSTVIASDYYKAVAASLRGLFGGEVKSLNSLMERGRREAICRMLEEARNTIEANVVWCVRIETSAISGQAKKKIGGVEFIAYGTAMKVANLPSTDNVRAA